jgi:hypothetical protein
LLWRSRDTVDLSPVEPLVNGASEPLTLDGDGDEWRTFTWKKAIPAPKDHVLWAVLMLNRGGASLTLADAAAGTGAERLLWGAPTGPWHDLPAALGAARGRIRVIGSARPDSLFAPLTLQVGTVGAAASVTQSVKGTPCTIAGPTVPQTGLTLISVTSHAPAAITLKDIDVVSTT